MNDRHAIGKMYEAQRAERLAELDELKAQAVEPQSGVQIAFEGLDRGIRSAMDVFPQESG